MNSENEIIWGTVERIEYFATSDKYGLVLHNDKQSYISFLSKEQMDYILDKYYKDVCVIERHKRTRIVSQWTII